MEKIYRYWNEDSKIMVLQQPEEKIHEFMSNCFIDENIMLFSGVKDNNGVKIYENDIIEYTQHYFNMNGTSINRKIVKFEYDRWNIFKTRAGETNIKVIGNIYENPELLINIDECIITDMKALKVVKINDDSLVFDNGMVLKSKHESENYETHYLDMSYLDIKRFDRLEFDLTNDNFFEHIVGCGIRLNPSYGWSVIIPGYGHNNGNYSDKLELIIIDREGNTFRTFDITECQYKTGL